MKNKALIITIISFLGIIILLTILFATNFNILASVPFLLILLSSFTLGLCNCMIGSTQKSSKWFAIISIGTFGLYALAVFNPDLYAATWNVILVMHIALIAWTFIQVSPSNIPFLQLVSRISVSLTALLFSIILLGSVGNSTIFLLLKIGLLLSSGSLIVQFILQSKLSKS